MPLALRSVGNFNLNFRTLLRYSTHRRNRHFHHHIQRAPSRIWHSLRLQSAGADLSQSPSAHRSFNIARLLSTAVAKPDVLSLEDQEWKHSVREFFPSACPGCGALGQIANPGEAGFYSRSRKAVKAYSRTQAVSEVASQQDLPVARSVDISHKEGGNRSDATEDGMSKVPSIVSDHLSILPVCDRCHDLIYNNTGQSIAHPTLENIADSITESPFRRNHVHHIVDAVDFPMSLIPRIFRDLELAKPRSQNRRARTKHTTKPQVSFIVTRSDLLGPTKQMVDRMMPYFQNILRTALGRFGSNMRLSNVHLVSAKRGWWTKELKDSIWDEGGAHWMLGKANVGKSSLFPVLFPKGSGDRAPEYAQLEEQQREADLAKEEVPQQDQHLAENSLLPPPQPETRFPAMPVVSHLPGTTASPIRLPFGNHRGELIDLPGLERGGLENYVAPSHRSDLIMQSRPNVKQHVIGPGQSLLLGGGLVRITPKLNPADKSTTMLAYPFVPIDVHVTATDKATATQLQDRESGIRSILDRCVGSAMKSAGKFQLNTDVTRTQAGPLLRAGVSMAKLPFRVYSSEILIEGVGWIELVCQVRRSRKASEVYNGSPVGQDHTSSRLDGHTPEDPSIDHLSKNTSEHGPTSEFEPFSTQVSRPVNVEILDEHGFLVPEVEVFSPAGKHIASRKPLGAWAIWTESARQRQGGTVTRRPRRSMKGAKKREKMASRVIPVDG